MSCHSLSPLYYGFKLIVGFVGDRPIALCPFFLVVYLFQSWLLHACSWFGKDGMKKVRFHASFAWKMEKYNELTLFWPTNTPTSSHLQERWKEWETRVGRVKNGPALLPGLLEWRDVRNLSLWSLGKECSVVLSSHVDLSIASWVRGYKDNSTHPGSKKEQYSLRYCESGLRPACHHGRSAICIFYVRDLFVIMRATHKIMWYGTIPYSIVPYWRAPR